MNLAGAVSVVTGGGRDIGRAICMALAEAGSDIAVLAGRDLASAQHTAEQVRALGRKAIARAVDVADPESVAAAVAAVVQELGRIDVLVNNAGVSFPEPLLATSLDHWNRALGVNLTGVFLMSTAVARQMQRGQMQHGQTQHGKGGAIVNVAAASAHHPYGGEGAYGPAKAAVVNLTGQMALEWADAGIRVNAVSPGPVLTAETQRLLEQDAIRRSIERLPMKRCGTPQEIAGAVRFLASPEASYVTGQTLIVDGGSMLTWYLTE